MKTSRHILCFDLGTTNIKAVLIDEDGRTVTVARRRMPSETSALGRSELTAEAFEKLIADLTADVARASESGLTHTMAVTFATQANSFILLDRHDEPLTPIILWPDARARGADEPINRLAEFRAITGVPKLDFEFMPAKLRWLREHAPAKWAKTRRICGIGDYLAMCLCGEHVTEAGVAALTGLVNARSLEWWPRGLEALEVRESSLPRIVRAGTDVGPIRPEAADRLGLPAGVRVIVGCLDQYAGAIGVGCVAQGRMAESTGTVLAVLCLAGEWRDDLPGDVFQGPAFDGNLYFRMAYSNTSANLLEWYRGRLAGLPSFESLDALAALEPASAGNLAIESIEQAESIERCFKNVESSHAPGQVVRAIMERVAQSLEELRGSLGVGLMNKMRSAGGAARSDLWLQIKADVLQSPVAASASPEPTSLGAAMLAARALGWGEMPDLAFHWCRVRKLFQPREHAQGAV